MTIRWHKLTSTEHLLHAKHSSKDCNVQFIYSWQKSWTAVNIIISFYQTETETQRSWETSISIKWCGWHLHPWNCIPDPCLEVEMSHFCHVYWFCFLSILKIFLENYPFHLYVQMPNILHNTFLKFSKSPYSKLFLLVLNVIFIFLLLIRFLKPHVCLLIFSKLLGYLLKSVLSNSFLGY